MKYLVEVTILAKVEVEANNEDEAEDKALETYWDDFDDYEVDCVNWVEEVDE